MQVLQGQLLFKPFHFLLEPFLGQQQSVREAKKNIGENPLADATKKNRKSAFQVASCWG